MLTPIFFHSASQYRSAPDADVDALGVQAESEARRAFLLRQAALKRGDDPEQAQLPEQPTQAEQPGGLLQHINFFVEHEARELHPEVPLPVPQPPSHALLFMDLTGNLVHEAVGS